MSRIEGQTIGEFKILSEIGHGGIGRVYLAEQPRLNRRVAVKFMRSEHCCDPEMARRFQREAMLAASLNHPGIVQVFAAGEWNGSDYIAMEYVEGESLHSRMVREGRIAPADALAIIIDIALALDHAWQKARLIHRDLKPSNILISTEGAVKVVDFGMARNADTESTLTATGMPIGTPLYISPELARSNRQVDFSADIYSLGCTLYHMLCGRPPFEGHNILDIALQHVSDPVPPITTFFPECPPPIVRLLDRMLAKNSRERHASYGELIGEIRRATSEAAGFRRKRPLAPTAAGAAALALLAGGGWYYFHHGAPRPATATAHAAALPSVPATPVPPAGSGASSPADDAFLAEVAALSPEDQARRVFARLQQLNPGFDPATASYITDGEAIGQVTLNITALADLGPIRALTRLRRLILGQPGQTGVLASILPVRGLPLVQFECHNAPLSDISPLRGMPLTWIVLQGTQVSDLSPLQESPLQAVGINNTPVTDLGPLRGKPIRFLNVGQTQVTDLTPLVGMPLTDVNFSRTGVRELSPLAGMALTRLICTKTSVEDFSAIRDMPLREIECDFDRGRHEQLLRGLGTLEKINGIPAADFWREL